MIKIFSLARVDVSLTMFYPLVFLLCYFWFGSIAEAILAGLAITLSVIIHEFGHAFACKRYDLKPSIVLQALGGYCAHQPSGSDKREAIVVVSGPVLQILIGLVGLLAMGIFGVLSPQSANRWVQGSVNTAMVFAGTFVFFSLFWGALNLLAPVWPLDGGKLFALILRRFTSEERAARVTTTVSIAVLIIAGIWAVTSRSFILVYLVFFLIMENVRARQAGSTLFLHSSGRVAIKKMSDYGEELLEEARARFAEEDWREAARLCHQLRASKEPISPKRLDEIWQILGLATLEQGDYEEALEWLRRAPKTPRIKAAIARCESQQAR